MPQKQKLKERNKPMRNQKIILQLARLLEQQNIISTSERMKMTDLIRKGTVTMRAVIYARCSTEEESQKDALINQVKEAKECVKRMDWMLGGYIH